MKPRDGKVYVVRWIREDGRETRHRYFRRLHDAWVWHARLEEHGRDVAMFVAHTEWAEVSFT